ncbi:MAG: LytTR family transcriptional regulator [Chitinophagaceae bacterium]|nr:LytTR family transcriptional regulator [Chitinophagaceae bacterium]
MNTPEQKLNPAFFIRIHRSAIVNPGMIKEVFRDNNGYHVSLADGTIQKVGRSYTEAI